MPNHPLSQDDLLGSREIRFISREETNYPNLIRMCMDFDFRVLQLLRTSADLDNTPGKQFVLTTRDYRSTENAAITPLFDNLAQLDAYVGSHQVDILHDYLFGFVEEDIDDAKVVGRE